MTVLNTRLIKHPLNWLIIWSMVLVLGYVAHLLKAFFDGRHPGDDANATASNAGGPGTSVPV